MQTTRLRRMRKNAFVRDWVSQTALDTKDLILPYFVVEGKGKRDGISSMPGVFHMSVDMLLKDLGRTPQIQSVLLFGIPRVKSKNGSGAHKQAGAVQQAIRAIKKTFPHIIVITDVCLCGYTSHGHCGIIIDASIDNDATLKVLARIAVSHAEQGADFVAPSAMMDGQVRAIREALDKKKFVSTGIMAYSAKYASGFYGPFREALESSPAFGDRKTHQMDYRNGDEALREIKHDIAEGADIVMVKPALAYLDIIYRAKQECSVPIAAYNVSGEYSMIKKASGGDISEEKRLALEVLTSIKRAGADFIISYWAKELVSWLKQ